MRYFINELLQYNSKRKATVIFVWAFFLLSIIGIMVISYLLIRSTNNSDQEQPLVFRWIIMTLVIFSNMVVVFNTVNFVVETVKGLYEADPTKTKKEKKNLLFINMFVIFLYLITIVLSAYIVHEFVRKVSGGINESWESIYFHNELVTVVIFLIFFIVDYYLLVSIDKSLKSDTSNQILIDMKDFTRKAFVFTDVAGFVGVLFIFFLILIFDSTYVHKVANPNGLFIHGFASGAIAMHILFTQMNYALLNTQKKV